MLQRWAQSARDQMPICFKDALPDDTSADTNYYMEKNDDGKWKLKREHAYFYQVQMQMAICKVTYCDFVVWSESGFIIERIKADNDFFEQKLETLYDYFVYGMLPEIIRKWYTRRPVADTTNVVPRTVSTEYHLDCEDEDITRLWCYCQEPSFGGMVLCDNEECPIKWFHFDCLRIRCPPKNHWYCPSCRKLPQFTKGKGSKKNLNKDSAINPKF